MNELVLCTYWSNSIGCYVTCKYQEPDTYYLQEDEIISDFILDHQDSLTISGIGQTRKESIDDFFNKNNSF